MIGHWSLVIGHWSLVIGYWSLVIGHWSLVIGHWVICVYPFRKLGAADNPRLDSPEIGINAFLV
jgi:hypothetical protein